MISQRVYPCLKEIMVRALGCLVFFMTLFLAVTTFADQVGSIRGVVYDKDFNVPLPAAEISIAETGTKVTATEDGNYIFNQVPVGKYTLIFSKEGYARQVEANVVVSPGQMTDVDVSLSGEFTEMEEVVAQDLQIAGTEAGLLMLRIESPALLDSVSSELISKAGANDAASALKLVTGATVQDDKYAVIRGLPDRYVNSQMNAVRLPSADAEKRAVQLDQFPSEMIESVQVSKTFTPDQQGDASGGAVNIVLKSIPDKEIFKIKTGTNFNTQSAGREDFLSRKGKPVNFWGLDSRGIPSDGDFRGPAGVFREDSPLNYNWSIAGGGKHTFDNQIKVGGFADFFYKRDSSFYNNGVSNSYWVLNPGEPLTPQYLQGTPSQGDFKTSLFDVKRSSEKVQWGSLTTVGVETENHLLNALYLYTHDANQTATLAEDTRGKAYYFPGYDPNNPKDLGNQNPDAAPYLRTETVDYTERSTQTFQLNGRHTLTTPAVALDHVIEFLPLKLDWTFARSSSTLNQPDKTQFGEEWLAPAFNAGFPPFVPPFVTPAVHHQFKPAANFTIGNLQLIWKDIAEDSNQYFVNLKFPFKQWSDTEGYFKFGVFDDKVTRTYNQQSFSNFGENGAFLEAPFDVLWSAIFGTENHLITPADIDVDYKGDQRISAWYYMVDLPTSSFLDLIGGIRHETTKLDIVNNPEKDVTWIPPGSSSPVTLKPGDADVKFNQHDSLPSVGFVLKPLKKVQVHSNYSETVARQTFKELTPIQQTDYLGGPIFIGNPQLKMSSVKNYDVRIDYTPYEGGLVSVSGFRKDIKFPIEYVQGFAGFSYTTAKNYPKGELNGIEAEVRQRMDRFWEPLTGLSLGGSATFINSKVTLPDDEAATFTRPNIQAPMPTRDMTNAPNHLYNIFGTYYLEHIGTEIGVFYIVTGDTLVEGAAAGTVLVPNVYAKEYGTLNVSVSKKIGQHAKVVFQAKNLLNPKIQTVYRSKFIDGDTVKTSYTKGIDYSLSVGVEW